MNVVERHAEQPFELLAGRESTPPSMREPGPRVDEAGKPMTLTPALRALLIGQPAIVEHLPAPFSKTARDRIVRNKFRHSLFATSVRESLYLWCHWCGRGDLNSHVLSDNRF